MKKIIFFMKIIREGDGGDEVEQGWEANERWLLYYSKTLVTVFE